MSQYRDGTVSVTNGSNVVLGVFRLLVVNVSGSFVLGQAIAFSPSGAAGKVVDWSPGGALLSCTITTAAPPAAGDAVVQSPSIGSATVSDIDFAPSFLGGSVPAGAVFVKSGSGIPYFVQAVGRNWELSLSTNYLGTTETGMAYSITTSFTPVVGLPYLEDGDYDQGAVSKVAALRLDELFAGVLSMGFTGSLSGSSRKSIRVRSDENGLELFEALDRKATFGVCTGNLTVNQQFAALGLLSALGGILTEEPHLIGSASEPAWENGWNNHGDSVSLRYPAAFWKQADGLVVMRGTVAKDALPNGETLFALPAGYRPSRVLLLLCVDAAGAPITVRIGADGAVQKLAGPTTAAFFVLDGLTFRADA